MGAKSGQRRNPSANDRSAGRQRLGLILFGGLLVVLFIAFAVTQGIGSPSVPSGDVAVVEDVPDEIANVSQEDFDRAFAQQVTQAKLKKAPEPGSDKYEELKNATLRELLDRIWITGEAEELDISVTDKQVEDELATIKKQEFSAPGAYEKFLKESKYTPEDVNELVKLRLLTTQIQSAVTGEAPKPSEEEIEAYYQAEKASQFTTDESRDVRIIINKDKGEVEAAKAELDQDSSPANWKKVAAKYSTDPTSKGKGGLQQGITEEFLQGPLKTAIFDSATGELKGPVQFQGNYILVEVVKLNAEKVQSLAEARQQISSTLGQEKQQEFFSEFVADYQSKWTQRTQCAEDFLTPQCGNYAGDSRPSNAAPACYEEDPKTPAKECPAPVTPISPALPGSVTATKPKGEPFPQRPLPEALAEQGEEVPTPVPGGTPPPTGE
ncbi:MAG: SurA N-terminal domain-containing protein [Actinomycetota bacterium]|nr:SurA N-terminal domain-containing protein [Actinomycetota bacterium]